MFGLRLVSAALAALFLLIAAPVQADYPDDCLGMGEPSGFDCGDLTYEGCCDDLGRVTWCDGGQLYCIDCAAVNPSCGWQGDFYDCGTDGGADPSGTFPLDCVTCDPACGPGEKCEDGQCVPCVADCDGKECGADGCGGTCGECTGDQFCSAAGLCEDVPTCEVAQDIHCDEVIQGDTSAYLDLVSEYSCVAWNESGPEVAYTFTSDIDDVVTVTLTDLAEDQDVFVTTDICSGETCVAYGNGEAQFDAVAGQTYYVVVDGYSGAQGTFTLMTACQSTCVPDCPEGYCGDDGCGGECGCPVEGDVCTNGTCCTPSCEGKQCGDNGCGGDCGDCAGACVDFLCVDIPGCVATGEPGCPGCACEACVCEMDSYCCDTAWDSLCANECANDCGGCEVEQPDCGDGVCDPTVFENCANCAEDCACDPADVCVMGGCCHPACSAENACQDDGCGGTCGCPDEGDICYEGTCCTPSCTGKDCGSDGCGGGCGECEAGLYCTEEGLCDPLPSCELKGTIACDDVIQGDTTGGTSLIDQYDCVGWNESGPENGYTFDAGVDDVVTLVLESDADLDLLVMTESCTADACVASGDSSITLEVSAGAHYFFVVDGYNGNEGAYTLTVSCASTCVPECTGKECGDDGCGGSCGECGEGTCADGMCHSGPGCETGSGPGCGGCACEACVCAMDSYCCSTMWDSICVGECINDCGGCPSFENCGDGQCDPDEYENCSSCPEDCACGDGETCGQLDGQWACVWDVCDFENGLVGCCDGTVINKCIDGVAVVADCAADGNICGWFAGTVDFPAGYYCGSEADLVPTGDPSGQYPLSCTVCDPACGPGEKCEDGQCVPCIPDCDGKSCGFDGCGGECGVCGEGSACVDDQCVVAGCEALDGPGCGGCPCEACVCEMDPYCCDTAWDSICAGECINDCGGCPAVEAVCGDAFCNGVENCGTCPADCGCADGFVCEAGACVEDVCTPDCNGLECGDDGCGGSCGECIEGYLCADGLCVPDSGAMFDPCETDQDCLSGHCVEYEGEWVCTQYCIEECPEGWSCEQFEEDNGDIVFICLPECTADCTDLECGDDGCGGSCGECAEGLTCIDGLCYAEDVPDCEDKECGDDGLGGSCGECDEGYVCEDYVCVEETCEPQCEGKTCGDDGCGGSCGDCAEGFFCNDIGQCEEMGQEDIGSQADLVSEPDLVTEELVEEDTGIPGIDVGGNADEVASDAGTADAGEIGETPKKSSDGCTAGTRGDSFAAILLLMALLGLALRRVRSTR